MCSFSLCIIYDIYLYNIYIILDGIFLFIQKDNSHFYYYVYCYYYYISIISIKYIMVHQFSLLLLPSNFYRPFFFS